MTGFRGFTLTHLSSIKGCLEFGKERNEFNQMIKRNLESDLDEIAHEFDLKHWESWGQQNKHGLWGVGLDDNLDDFGVRIFAGLSSEYQRNDYTPPQIWSEEQIPDCQVFLQAWWWESEQERDEFEQKHNLQSGTSDYFPTQWKEEWWGFMLMYRKSLIDFLAESDQQFAMVEFLKNGLLEIGNPKSNVNTALRNMLNER